MTVTYFCRSGLSTLFAAPASAHTTGVTGVAECVDASGTWKVTWTLGNDFNKAVTFSNVTLTPPDANATPPSSIDARANGGPVKTATFTSTARDATKVRHGRGVAGDRAGIDSPDPRHRP